MFYTVTEHIPCISGRLARRTGPMLLGAIAVAAVISGCSTSSPTLPRGTSAMPGTTSAAVTSADTSGTPAPASEETLSQAPITSSETAVPQPFTSAPATTSPTVRHPASGTPFPGEGLTVQQATDLQKSVDGGHQPWRLDRVQVAKSFVQGRFGWTSVQTSTGAPMVVFATDQDGSRVALHLAQPATQGDHGIWIVDSGVWS